MSGRTMLLTSLLCEGAHHGRLVLAPAELATGLVGEEGKPGVPLF